MLEFLHRLKVRVDRMMSLGNFIIGLASLVVLHIFNPVFAASIEKPAGALPIPRNDRPSDAPRLESSKSKVVPLQRKIDVASRSARNVQKAKTGDRKLKKIATSQAPAVEKKATSMGSTEASSSIATQQIGEGQDVWDSANKRYDSENNSDGVSQGVRVEDIIEPSADYRYSGARRKNPFIPEIILSGGPVGRQRELSPSDVEIPIVSPLQAFTVKELAVIGVWETDDRVWKALIATPANHGIEAKLGDPIGNSGGRIMSITPDAVIVREFSVRVDGTREYRDTPLRMGSDAIGEAPALDKVGGRLILRPGATMPEIVPPDSQNKSSLDVVISNSSSLVPSGTPGTLKSVVRINEVDAGSEPQKPDALGNKPEAARDAVKVNQDAGSQSQSKTPGLGGPK